MLGRKPLPLPLLARVCVCQIKRKQEKIIYLLHKLKNIKLNRIYICLHLIFQRFYSLKLKLQCSMCRLW